MPSNNSFSYTGARHTPHLRAPDKAERHTLIPSQGDSSIALDFAPDSTTPERVGANLVFHFQDGGDATILNYFATGQTLPSLVLPDGATTSAQSLFSSLDASSDDNRGTSPSGGDGEYTDTPGQLLDGVDRLGSLGTTQWGRATEVSELATTPVTRLGTTPPDDTPPDDTTPPDTTPGDNPPDGNPPDGNPPDGNPPDGNPPDGNPPDGNPPDGNPPDGNPPDGNPPDGNPPDGNPPDGNPPDGNPPHITLTPEPPDEGHTPPPGTPDTAIDALGVHLTANEGYLPHGSLAAEDAGSLQTRAAFRIQSTDGLSALVLNDATYQVTESGLADFPEAGIAAVGGLLTNPGLEKQADGEYLLSFDYVLSGPHTHTEPGTDSEPAGAPVTLVAVSESGAKSDSVQLTVDIIDDIPTAVDDGTLIVEDGGSPATLNLLDNDAFGADQPDARVVIGAVVRDAAGHETVLDIGKATVLQDFGSVTLNADGSLEFSAVNLGRRELTYTIKDADGDESAATVILAADRTLNPAIIPHDPHDPDAQVSLDALNLTVAEHGRIEDAYTLVDAGTFTVRSDADYDSVTFQVPGAAQPLTLKMGSSGGVAITDNGITYGNFAVITDTSGRVGYTFTLAKALDNDADPSPAPAFLSGLTGEKGELSITVTAKDGLGQVSAPATFTVDILDDAPRSTLTFQDEDGIVWAGSSTPGSFDIQRGADERDGQTLNVNGTDITADNTDVLLPDYGTLSVNRDGSFVFTALDGADQPARDVTFTYTDADGDTTSQILTLGVKTPVPPEKAVLSATVDEAGLDGIGTQGDTDKEYGRIDLPEGWTVTDTAKGVVSYGQVVQKDGDWYFQLTGPLTHTGEGTDTQIPQEKPVITVRDDQGNPYDKELDITVQDDVLAVAPSTADVTWTASGGAASAGGLFLNNARISLENPDAPPGSGVALSTTNALALSAQGISLSTRVVRYDDQGTLSVITGEPLTGLGNTPAVPGLVYSDSGGMYIQDSYFDKYWTQYPERLPVGGLDRLNEINYDLDDNASEALVIDLDGIAFGTSLELGEFYGGRPGTNEVERGRITFYLKNDQGAYDEVGHQDFSSTDPGGGFNGSFENIVGGFDRVVISATHNGVSVLGSDDNSDFSIKSIQFDTFGEPHARYEQGFAASDTLVRGADGLREGSIIFDKAMDGQDLRTDLGDIHMDVNEDGNYILGTLANGDKAFEMVLTLSTGRWDYVQYQDFTLQDDQGNAIGDTLNFQYLVTDNDGDVSTADIVVGDSAPVPAPLPAPAPALDTDGDALAASDADDANGATASDAQHALTSDTASDAASGADAAHSGPVSPVAASAVDDAVLRGESLPDLDAQGSVLSDGTYADLLTGAGGGDGVDLLASVSAQVPLSVGSHGDLQLSDADYGDANLFALLDDSGSVAAVLSGVEDSGTDAGTGSGADSGAASTVVTAELYDVPEYYDDSAQEAVNEFMLQTLTNN